LHPKGRISVPLSRTLFIDTGTPALLTAIHIAMAIVRRHRTRGQSIASPFVAPSFLFVLAPWIWYSPTGLLTGFVVHMVWFMVCEWTAPKAAPTAKPRPVPIHQPAAPPAAKAEPRRGSGFEPATVITVLDESPEIKTFRMRRPDGFEFQPGQFLTVRFLTDGKPQVRCYSISSPPHARGYLEISVRNQGMVSSMLHATVRAGSVLSINRPAGGFVYPAGDDRPLVLMAGGIGITPLMSMLRHAAACDPTRPVTLLYSARTEQALAFRRELHVLAERHPHIRVAMTVTRPTEVTRVRTGRLDADLVRQYVPAPQHSIFCLCGPLPMIEDTRHLLADLGVPNSQVRYEQFDLAVAASQLNPAAAQAPAAATGTETVSVRFASSGVTVSAPASQTLLEAAEDAGVDVPSACRSGVCQTCRTRLTSGTADCRSDVLDPDDRGAGFILPCVTWPTGDCELEA